jgi:hypothetical protein
MEIIEGKIKGRIEVTRRRGRRRKQLLDDLGDRRGYSNLKEEAYQIQKLSLPLVLPGPVNSKEYILYQNICASAIILEFLLISLHNL